MSESLENEEHAQLELLGKRFMAALQAKTKGKLDHAEDELRAILRVEPRLAEPRMELARIMLDSDRLDEAEPMAREALEQLKTGGRWTDQVPENVLLGLAHALLAEVLRRHADEDDVIFGDADRFRAIVDESQSLFAQAAELDDSDDYSSYYAFFMGVEGAEIKI